MTWVMGSLAVLLLISLILWMATQVERDRAGRRKPGIRVNSIFSGPVGTGIYKPIDDRRAPSEEGKEK